MIPALDPDPESDFQFFCVSGSRSIVEWNCNTSNTNLVRHDGGEGEGREHGDGGREEELEDAQREPQRHRSPQKV